MSTTDLIDKLRNSANEHLENHDLNSEGRELLDESTIAAIEKGVSAMIHHIDTYRTESESQRAEFINNIKWSTIKDDIPNNNQQQQLFALEILDSLIPKLLNTLEMHLKYSDPRRNTMSRSES